MNSNMDDLVRQEVISLIRDIVQIEKEKDAEAGWKRYFICKGRINGERNCGKIFFNDDDNVCKYCGSKNTRRVHITHKIVMPY